jgi:predicted nucleic acid-binding protein
LNGVPVLDAGVLISHLDSEDPHHTDSVCALAGLADAGERFTASALTISEALVRPASESEAAMDAAYYVLTDEVGVEVHDLTDEVAFEISRACARHA